MLINKKGQIDKFEETSCVLIYNFLSALGPEMTLNIYCYFPLQVSAISFSSCSDPRVLKYLPCCVALLGIHYQQPGYEVFCCYYERKKRRENIIGGYSYTKLLSNLSY